MLPAFSPCQATVAGTFAIGNTLLRLPCRVSVQPPGGAVTLVSKGRRRQGRPGRRRCRRGHDTDAQDAARLHLAGHRRVAAHELQRPVGLERPGGAADLDRTPGAVSYTHLTLPTKRRV